MSAAVQNRNERASGGNRWFTTTHWSVVLTARTAGTAQAAEALETLCRTYWYPLYACVRQQGHSPTDAQDLTQAFFARLLAKEYLSEVDRQKGKFRSFLQAAIRHFLADEAKRARAEKRGGGQTIVSLDEASAEARFREEATPTLTPDEAFDQRWALTLLDRALARLRREFAGAGKEQLFDLLKGFLSSASDDGAYLPIANRFGMTAGAVAVQVHRLRQRYRELVREEVAQTVTNPKELEEEMRYLFSLLSR